jgi:hypothetical protein
MKDPYNWHDPAHPQRGYVDIETPTTRDEVFDLIRHLKKPEDRQWQMQRFDEGFMLGGIKKGLQFMQEDARERRQGPERYIPPAY